MTAAEQRERDAAICDEVAAKYCAELKKWQAVRDQRITDVSVRMHAASECVKAECRAGTAEYLARRIRSGQDH